MKEKYKLIAKQIKFIVTVVIISGVLIHLFMVYNTAKSLEIEDKKIVGIYLKYPSIDEYEVKFMLALNNPKTTEIEIDYISYSIYVENEFVGSGKKPHFIIQHGIHNYSFLLSFSILNLSSATKSLLIDGDEINIRIKGDVLIPAKFLGLFTWRYIKLPYEMEEKVKLNG
ncbi:MAG TPA: hypothetical protein ENI33_03820 [Thermoplasmatales archaeon]|nr:hypothetical protein [Thermoplasmatales archaeon]